MNPQTQTQIIQRRIALLRRKADRLIHDRAAAMAARNLAKATSLTAQIERFEAEARRLEEDYMPRPLGELIDINEADKARLNRRLLQAHLIADVLADVTLDIKESITRLGAADCALFHLLDDINRPAQKLANALADPKTFPDTWRVITDNDRLISDIYLLTDRYIDQHVTFTRP